MRDKKLYACRAGAHSDCKGRTASKLACRCICHALPPEHPWVQQKKRLAGRLWRNGDRVAMAQSRPDVRPRVAYHDQPLEDELVEAIFDISQPWGQYGTFDSPEAQRQYYNTVLVEQHHGEDGREYRLRHLGEQAARTKAEGRCHYWGCVEDAQEDRSRCVYHAQLVNERKRHKASQLTLVGADGA